MANTFTPIVLKDVNFVLGDEATGPDFKCQLKSITLTPDTNVIREKTMCPEGQYSAVDDPEWTLELGYLWGTDTAASGALADFLLAHKGETMAFAFRPIADGKGYNGSVIIVAGALGGDYGEFAEQSVSLPLVGQPAALTAKP